MNDENKTKEQLIDELVEIRQKLYELEESVTKRKDAEEDVLRQKAVLSAINEILVKALTCETEEELGKTCLSVVEELTGSKFGFFGELNQEGHFDTIAISNPGWDACTIPSNEASLRIKNMPVRGVDRATMRDGKSRIVNGEEAIKSHVDHVNTPEGHPAVTAFLGVPVKHAGETIGMIGLGNKEGGYTIVDQENVETLSVAMMEALRRKRAEGTLKKSEEKLSIIYRTVDSVLFQLSIEPDNVFIFSSVNKSFLTATGLSEEQVIGKRVENVIPESSHALVLSKYKEAMRDKKTVRWEETSAYPSGVKIGEVTITPILNDEGYCTNLIGTVHDITERKHAEEKMLHMAYHDPLTGLPNRSLMIDRLNQVLARKKRQNGITAILFLDLDRFKLINDTFGHIKGDELLKEVSERLKKNTRDADTVARQGGDEFIVVVQDINSIEDKTKVASRYLIAFEDPFHLDGQALSVKVSIGISIYPNDGEDADALLKNADIALYEAKEKGRNSYQFYAASMNKSIAKKLKLENKLRMAIEEEQFVLHYQPQIDIKTGEAIGIEALVRWQEPETGLIPPGEFIPLAEDTGLIVLIGEWVLRTACTQNEAWQRRGLKPLTMAVNISIRQFKQNNFVDTIKRILEKTNLNPKYLELELTESIIMDDVESTISVLHELKAMGVRLSIDDFGTGYSSLQYLKQMPLDMLKVAHTFVRDITVDSNDAAIAKATIQMAQSLNLEVIAEGVETVEHFKLLRTLQCNKIQGYLVSKPLPSEEVEGFLEKEWLLSLD